MRISLAGLALLLAAAVSGCGGADSSARPGVVSLSSSGPNRFVYQEVTSAEQIKPGDQLQVIVDMVQITAPAGAVSERAAFWQIVHGGMFDRDFLQVLNTNGVRTGIMSAAEWPELRKTIELAPGVISQTATLAGQKRATVNMRPVAQETIFYFDRLAQLQGRSYENAENFWGVFFSSDPARPGNVSVEVAPVVRSARRLMRMNKVGGEYQLDYEQPETVLDLAIKTSLPLGAVLVIAPTRTATELSTSIGRAFLIQEEPGGLSEQLLFFYSRVYRLNPDATEKERREAQQEERRQEREAKRRDEAKEPERSDP